jgi:hypothetical protein
MYWGCCVSGCVSKGLEGVPLFRFPKCSEKLKTALQKKERRIDWL